MVQKANLMLGAFSTSQPLGHAESRFVVRFPVNPIVSARWTEQIRLNRNESYWKPTKHSKICSIHFHEKEKYITKGGLCRLRPDAVPTKDVPVFCISIKNNEKLMDSQPKPGTSISECADPESMDEILDLDRCLSPIFDSPKQAFLRMQLKKKNLRLRIQSRKIKTLQQKIRRLIKKNRTLQNRLSVKYVCNITKERCTDNDLKD